MVAREHQLGLVHHLPAQVAHHGVCQERRRQHLVDHGPGQKGGQNGLGRRAVFLHLVHDLEQPLEALPDSVAGEHVGVEGGQQLGYRFALLVVLVAGFVDDAFHELVGVLRCLDVLDGPRCFCTVHADEELCDDGLHALLISRQSHRRPGHVISVQRGEFGDGRLAVVIFAVVVGVVVIQSDNVRLHRSIFHTAAWDSIFPTLTRVSFPDDVPLSTSLLFARGCFRKLTFLYVCGHGSV
mmetsp:Transcript_73315/g.153053  ORF Transcript_73315/g.153053 Transcript_73315/m.153053 type:complete len:239 (+) Transcript_73315:539-1255(+)